MDEINKMTELCLAKAERCNFIGDTGTAYSCYQLVLQYCPGKRSELESKITDILYQWGTELQQMGKTQQVFECYEECLEYYPNNLRILHNLAAHYLLVREPLKAIKYLDRALSLNPDYLPAWRNYQNALSMTVDRWHFPMLNDRLRNNLFAEAISKKVKQGYETILDIGTGTGILSLYAKAAGADEIYACECTKPMYDIAKKVFERNHASDVKLIPKLSMDLKMPQDIPRRVQMIVTETFDAGLFGESIIETLTDAHTNLLERRGVIVPHGASLFVSAVRSDHLQQNFSVEFENDSKLFSPLDFGKTTILLDEYYYDTENLNRVTVNHITEPVEILSINFNSLIELNGFKGDGIKSEVRTRCRSNGTINSLVAWFKLKLDQELEIDTMAKNSCWEPAVFPLVSLNCRENDEVQITAEIQNEQLKLSITKINGEELVHIQKDKRVYRFSREMISFLNDTEYMRIIGQMAESHATQKVHFILDTSPFPVYGMIMLKRNEHIRALYYNTQDEQLIKFIKDIAVENGLQKRIHFVTDYSEIPEHCVDNVFVHNFSNGEIIEWENDSYHKYFKHLLSPKGIILPTKICLMGQFVYSEDLIKMTKVSDENLQGNFESSKIVENGHDAMDNEASKAKIVVAEFINQYKLKQFYELNSSLYDCEFLSTPVSLLEVDKSNETRGTATINRYRVEDRLPNAIICFYKIDFTDDLSCTTKGENSFINHTALIIDDEMKLVSSNAEDLKVQVSHYLGFIKLNFPDINQN